MKATKKKQVRFILKKKPSVMSHILQMQAAIPNATHILVSPKALYAIIAELQEIFLEDHHNPVLPLLAGDPVSYLGMQWLVDIDSSIEDGTIILSL